jgi:transposase
MRRVREILRYRFEQGLGHKSIAVRVGTAPSTVRETLRRAAVAGLSWPLGDDFSDAVLEAALYRAAGTKTGHRRAPEPDWAQVHRELKRKHVTLQILWDEYIGLHPDGYRYSRYCDLYRGWALKLPVTMRQDHAAGDKLFVDYAGDTVSVVVDRLSGKTRQAHLFVAVMGASSLCATVNSPHMATSTTIRAFLIAHRPDKEVTFRFVAPNTQLASDWFARLSSSGCRTEKEPYGSRSFEVRASTKQSLKLFDEFGHALAFDKIPVEPRRPQRQTVAGEDDWQPATVL